MFTMVDSARNLNRFPQENVSRSYVISEVPVRDFQDLEKERYNDENLVTVTSEDQVSIFSGYIHKIKQQK